MLKTENNTLVIYEFDAYVHVLDTVSKYKVCDILVTEDDLEAIGLQGNDINWIKVERIDIVDIDEVENYAISESKKRICGSFETKPVYWTYAKIIINDITNNRRLNAITEMPRSPVVPVVFDVKA
jgi:hypothetical protein